MICIVYAYRTNHRAGVVPPPVDANLCSGPNHISPAYLGNMGIGDLGQITIWPGFLVRF